VGDQPCLHVLGMADVDGAIRAQKHINAKRKHKGTLERIAISCEEVSVTCTRRHPAARPTSTSGRAERALCRFVRLPFSAPRLDHAPRLYPAPRPAHPEALVGWPRSQPRRDPLMVRYSYHERRSDGPLNQLVRYPFICSPKPLCDPNCHFPLGDPAPTLYPEIEAQTSERKPGTSVPSVPSVPSVDKIGRR
jgi:hypothetical protein